MDIRHRTPLPSLIVTMGDGRGLIRGDLMMLGIGGIAYYVHIYWSKWYTPLVLTSFPPKLRSARLKSV